MKLLKAFVRNSKVDEVIRTLETAHAPGIAISRVHEVGYGCEPYFFTLAPREIPKTQEVAKLEVFCGDDEVEGLLETLIGAARTGSQGDGVVFITGVEDAVSIRSGQRGESVLRL